MNVPPDAVTARDRVLLDASAIIGAGYGRSQAFRRLLREAGDRRIELLVPELAIVETLAVLRRKLENMKVASREGSRLLAAGGVEMPTVDELVARCERHLRDSLANANVTPLPSQADHDVLIHRILGRRKPTKPTKRNPQDKELDDQPEDYRDQLLWAMAREAAKTGPLIFVSDNSDDFADPESVDRAAGRATLHADLRDDLAQDAAAGGAGKVDLYLTIRRVTDERLSRPEDEDDRVEMQRLIDGVAARSLALALREYVHASAVDVAGYMPPLPLTSDVEEAELIDIDLDIDAQVIDAYQLASESEPRRYEVSLEVQVSGDVAWHVTAVSSYDHEALAAHVESADAGGLIQDVDYEETIHLRTAGAFIPRSDEWEVVEIEEAEQPQHVIMERRAEIPDPALDLLNRRA